MVIKTVTLKSLLIFVTIKLSMLISVYPVGHCGPLIMKKKEIIIFICLMIKQPNLVFQQKSNVMSCCLYADGNQ